MAKVKKALFFSAPAPDTGSGFIHLHHSYRLSLCAILQNILWNAESRKINHGENKQDGDGEREKKINLWLFVEIACSDATRLEWRWDEYTHDTFDYFFKLEQGTNSRFHGTV